MQEQYVEPFKKMPHAGQLLRTFTKEKRIYLSAWARHQGVKPHMIQRFFKKPTMQISNLYLISIILKNNFIREIADTLPTELPSRSETVLKTENDNLKKEIEKLKMENELLKGIIEKAVSRNS
jgi:hypothetical protein